MPDRGKIEGAILTYGNFREEYINALEMFMEELNTF